MLRHRLIPGILGPVAALAFLMAGWSPQAAAGGVDFLEPVRDRYEAGQTAVMVGYTSAAPGAHPGGVDGGPYYGHLRADPAAAEADEPGTWPYVHPTDVPLGPTTVTDTGRDDQFGVRLSITFPVPAGLAPGSYHVFVCNDTAIGGAEVAVSLATGARIGVRTPRYLLVSHRGDSAAMEQAVRAALPPATAVRFRAPGETPFLRHGDAVLTQAQVKERFGEFAYMPPAAGREFRQDAAWQAENLVTRDLPIVGRARCHRATMDALAGALAEVAAAGLSSLVPPDGFAGCWNPRLTEAGGSVSHHAWGIAADIGYGDNPTGAESVQDPRVVEIFARWGFTSGGDWLVPDAAHFEVIRPRAPAPGAGVAGGGDAGGRRQ